MKVRALKLGYYGDKRKRPGDVFLLRDKKEFSKHWMVEVSGKVAISKDPEHAPTARPASVSVSDKNVI